MLSTADLAVLRHLSEARGPVSAKTLADKLGYSRTHIYRVFNRLTSHGYCTESRHANNERYLSLTHTQLANTYRQLIENDPAIDWADLLTPGRIKLCSLLDTPKTVAELSSTLDISTQRIYQLLTPLKQRAMLTVTDSTYTLADDLASLADLCTTIITQEHRHRITELASTATLHWATPENALVRATTPTDTDALDDAENWYQTGLAEFTTYGLEFYLAGQPAFWYSQHPPTPAELICHTLRLETDDRRLSYCMLLTEVTDIDADTLRETASNYDIEDTIETVLNGPDDTDTTTPSTDEYHALKQQYGVA